MTDTDPTALDTLVEAMRENEHRQVEAKAQEIKDAFKKLIGDEPTDRETFMITFIAAAIVNGTHASAPWGRLFG